MEDIRKHLLEFDRERGWNQYENFKNSKEKIDYLFHAIVWLTGEVGEFANLLKKFERDKTYDEEKLKDELADIFIFVMKIAQVLNINLKDEYFRKMKINDKRFEHFKT